MFDAPMKVLSLMHRFKSNWFVAGGWAMDLYLERETRRHEDIEIAIFRRDQIALQNYLGSWILMKAVNGALLEWNRDERLELPVHEIHCFNDSAELSSLEVLLNETDGNKWLYRRNAKVSKPISKLHLTSNLRINFLRPEVVLLYKSKNPRLKDEQDFESVAPNLDVESRQWLKNALATCYEEHSWIQKL